jgi:oligopeptide/dipeptide ABC transporter ATP-binding protein
MNSIPSLHKRGEKLRAIPGIIPSPKDFPKGCRFQDRCPLVIDKCRFSEPPLIGVDGHLSACFRADEVTFEIYSKV